MICPVCDKEVRPFGFATGLQELLAARIHLAKEHHRFRSTFEMAEWRVLDEREIDEIEVVYVDVDKDERWLGG